MARGPRIVLGAGCAGLSLAAALVDAGVEDEIIVLDRRRSFPDDRTWCFWDVDGTNPFAAAAEHRWTRWAMTDARGTVVSHRAPALAYHHLSVGAMRAAALATLEASGQVQLRLGERVQTVREEGGTFLVDTARGTLRGAAVYDGMAEGSPRRSLATRRGPALVQSFLGVEVTTRHPIFDPATPTLMDFSVAQQPDVLHFLYVLPFAADRALLEHTTLGPHGVSAGERRRAIDTWLAERGTSAVAVHREERGRLPMARSAVPAGGVIPIGTVAGAIRPSSGYAFSRIQAHVQQVARAAARGEPEHAPVAPAWLDLLDEIFLRTLAHDPSAFAAWFPRLAAGMSGPGFARFMADAPRPDDLARAVAALPKLPFLRSALETVVDRLDAPRQPSPRGDGEERLGSARGSLGLA